MKRIINLVAITFVLVYGCGQDAGKTTTISWWQFWTDAGIKPLIQEMAKEFEALHPGVKVDLVDLTWGEGHEKIAIALSSGSGPDVVELGSDWIAEFAASGHLSDITTAVDSIRHGYLMWDAATFNTRIYGFPWILGTRVLFINTDLLSQAGYEKEFLPGSWNELLEAATKVRNLGANIYGFGSNSAERHRLYKKFLPFLWANGGDILSPDRKSCLLKSPEAVAALEYYLKLCQTGITDTQRGLEDLFLDGKIGFVISGDWLLKRIKNDKPNFPLATSVIAGPSGSQSSISFAGGEYLAINSASPYAETALALIRFICSPDNQIRFCLANRTANPSSVMAAADAVFLSQPHYSTFIDQLRTSKSSPSHPQWVYIEAELEKGIEEALYGTKPPKSALMDAAARIENILKR